MTHLASRDWPRQPSFRGMQVRVRCRDLIGRVCGVCAPTAGGVCDIGVVALEGAARVVPRIRYQGAIDDLGRIFCKQ